MNFHWKLDFTGGFSWWLSFCDPDKPQGTQFLGAAIVTAPDFISAVKMAHRLGCNPGGEVQGGKIPEDTAPFINESWRNRILTRAECTEFDQHLQAVCTPAAERAKACSGVDNGS